MSAINPTQAALSSNISFAVAGKTQDVAKAQGEAVVSMIADAAQLQEQSTAKPIDPSRGSHLDVTG